MLSLAAFAVAVNGEACRAEISSISPISSILHICSIAALASARAASTAALASAASALACSVAPRFASRWESGMGDSMPTADAADGVELVVVDGDLIKEGAVGQGF